MGSGCSSQDADETENVRLHRQGNLTFYIYGTPYLENSVSGRGCRKTVSWRTTCTREEIDSKIKEFWETRVDGLESVWAVLKQASGEHDSDAIERLLQKSRITMPGGLLQQTYDERGHRYDLPPFIINPALRYGVSQPRNENIQIDAKNITITVRSVRFSDTQLEIGTSDTGMEVKQKVLEKLGLKKKIRIFFAGKEIMDERPVGNYSVKNLSILQLFIVD